LSAPASFVLDCSVALGAFFEDEQDAYSLQVWRSLEAAQAVVPALWHLEMANILVRAQRAKRISAAALAKAWGRLDAMGLQTINESAHARHWLQRAGDWQLSAYDACYLDLALQQRLPLASKDKALVQAAQRIGVPLYLQP
jgi:predicted nucleic acid-binding protein